MLRYIGPFEGTTILLSIAIWGSCEKERWRCQINFNCHNDWIKKSLGALMKHCFGVSMWVHFDWHYHMGRENLKKIKKLSSKFLFLWFLVSFKDLDFPTWWTILVTWWTTLVCEPKSTLLPMWLLLVSILSQQWEK